MSAKSLGQIHAADHKVYALIEEGDRYLFDNASALSNSLDHMVRHGQYFKLCGIDMTLIPTDIAGNPLGGVSALGEFRYYAPTRGRCAAFRQAFESARKIMSIQGTKLSDNKQYDFRVPLTDLTLYINGANFGSQATLQGPAGTGLALYSQTVDQSVFDSYNANLKPESDLAPEFGAGLATAFDTSPSDQVLDPVRLYSGSDVPHAYTPLETIPWQIVWEPDDPDSKTATPTFSYRPDPALYIAVLTGQVEVYFQYLDMHDDAVNCNINMTCWFAGWKSIMGDPDKKRRSKRNSHGRKHRSTKKN